jgi:hypothetical protein
MPPGAKSRNPSDFIPSRTSSPRRTIFGFCFRATSRSTTGAVATSKQEIPLNPPFFGMAQSDSGMTVISSDESGRETITRIAFPNGTVQTVPIESGAAVATPSREPAATTHHYRVTHQQRGLRDVGEAGGGECQPRRMERTSWGDKFVPDGANVVQMKVDLIERKTITHQAMKAQKKSMVEDNLTSGQSLEASEQVINDLRREQTGGVEEEDASRYQVTLRRWPASAAPDWTGEVIGAPSFFALKTRDVLVAGNSILVFDKNNPSPHRRDARRRDRRGRSENSRHPCARPR